MEINRRHFFKISGALAAASLVTADKGATAAQEAPLTSQDTYGCLVDTTLCVGCRKCEQACNDRHSLPKPAESFEELAVLEKERRMDETTYTVANALLGNWNKEGGLILPKKIKTGCLSYDAPF